MVPWFAEWGYCVCVPHFCVPFWAWSSDSRKGVWRRSARLSWEAEVTMRYKVLLHRTDEGISVSVPGLPGCWSEGDTEEEALENIRDAIREYVAALEDQTRSQDVREVEVAI